MHFPKPDQVAEEIVDILVFFQIAPVKPGDLVVLAVSVVVAKLGVAKLISGKEHRRSPAGQQHRAGILDHPPAKRIYLRIFRLPLRPAVPAAVVAGSVGIPPAVGLVVLLIVGIEIIQGEAVVTGKEIDGIELKDKAKYNADAHQGALSTVSNYLQLALYAPKDFKTYYEKFIGKRLNKTVIQYDNSGLIAPQQFLGKDFFIEKDKIFYADESGYIPTSYPDVYICANKNRPYQLPKLSKSSKSAQQVCSDFLINTYECYGKNGVSALLVIGRIVMGLFFDYFLKKNIGIPLLIICGVSSSGKTTLIQNGIAILGMGEDFLIAGDSTANGQQFIAQSINNVACPVDDVFEAVLNSKKLGAKIKSSYRATPKIRMRTFGQEPDLCQICSQLIYTANGNIPQIQELVNRANVISINDTTHFLSNAFSN